MENENNKFENEKENQKQYRIIKLIILIVLIMIMIITSFKSGERFFEIKNANFDDSYSKVNSSVAYWYFDAEIKLKD